MSEYTAYTIVHIDNLESFRSRLAEEGISAAIEIDDSHPCFPHPAEANERWAGLTYQQKWVIVISSKPVSQLSFVEVWGSILIQEDGKRWLLSLADKSRTTELLFSDSPWGDYSDADPQKDWDRIKHARNIGEDDLAFMEKCFKLKRFSFERFLGIGEGNAMSFMKAVGWPAIYMLDDGRFVYEPIGDLTKGRVMLWDEFEQAMD